MGTSKRVGLCAECAGEAAIVARGLCRRCYDRPAVREKHAVLVPGRATKRAQKPGETEMPRKQPTLRDTIGALFGRYADAEDEATALLLVVAGSVARLRQANRALRLALIKARAELLAADKECLAAVSADPADEKGGGA